MYIIMCMHVIEKGEAYCIFASLEGCRANTTSWCTVQKYNYCNRTQCIHSPIENSSSLRQHPRLTLSLHPCQPYSVSREKMDTGNQLIVVEEWKVVKSGHYLGYTYIGSGWSSNTKHNIKMLWCFLPIDIGK